MTVPFANPTDSSLVIGKQYHAMAQYSRFIRQGAAILPTADPEGTVAALMLPERTGVAVPTVVVVKTSFLDSEMPYEVDLAPCSSLGGGPMVEAFRTSASENMHEIARWSVEQMRFRVSLAPSSITTFVIRFQPGATGYAPRYQ